jgi:hypothetical protein
MNQSVKLQLDKTDPDIEEYTMFELSKLSAESL